MRTLILEDNRDRRIAMIGRLAERFPFIHVIFFDTSNEMIDFLKSESLLDVAVISLDHDLEFISGPNGDWVDPGTGLEVARWLSEQAGPICPVVVHTTNSREGGKMMRLLEKSHWVSHRVVPHDDLRWIDTDWFRVVRNAIVESAPKRRSTPIPGVVSKVGLIRSLLATEYESGQAFSRAAIARIVDAYACDLRKTLDKVSVEVMSFVEEDVPASVLDGEGPIIQWCREEGVPLGVFSEWAERGPLGLDQLELGANAAQRLSRSGVNQIQVKILEVAEMQALLVVSAARSLGTGWAQATVTELKAAIEIAIFVGVQWSPSRKQSILTNEKKGNRPT